MRKKKERTSTLKEIEKRFSSWPKAGPKELERIIARNKVNREEKVKITAWIDADLLLALKEQAEQEGFKYQTLMNHLLRKAVFKKDSLEKRIEALEDAIKALAS